MPSMTELDPPHDAGSSTSTSCRISLSRASGASEVNQLNRIKLMLATALQSPEARDSEILQLVDVEEPASCGGSGSVMLGMPTIPSRRAAFR